MIDGGTLPFVLNPVLNPVFLNVARRCVSVICSRATPIQKVYTCTCTCSLHMCVLSYIDIKNIQVLEKNCSLGIHMPPDTSVHMSVHVDSVHFT